MAKIQLGQRLMRALFVSLGVGMFGGVGMYLLTIAVNTLAGATVLDPIAFLLLILGGAIFTGVGIEWSKDIASAENETDKGGTK